MLICTFINSYWVIAELYEWFSHSAVKFLWSLLGKDWIFWFDLYSGFLSVNIYLKQVWWAVVAQSVVDWAEKLRCSCSQCRCRQDLQGVLVIGEGARTPCQHLEQGSKPSNAHIGPAMSWRHTLACLHPYIAPSVKPPKGIKQSRNKDLKCPLLELCKVELTLSSHCVSTIATIICLALNACLTMLRF